MTGWNGTPGPWQVVPESKALHRWVVGDAEGASVASCEPVGPWMSDEVATANAKGMAAVPDMIAALLRLHNSYPPGGDVQRITGEALTKAGVAL